MLFVIIDGNMGEIDVSVEYWLVVLVPVSILGVLRPLMGLKGGGLVCVVCWLSSGWWEMTAVLAADRVNAGTFWRVVILVVVLLETNWCACFPIFVCSIGWEVLGVMVGFPVLVEICP